MALIARDRWSKESLVAVSEERVSRVLTCEFGDGLDGDRPSAEHLYDCHIRLIPDKWRKSHVHAHPPC